MPHINYPIPADWDYAASSAAGNVSHYLAQRAEAQLATLSGVEPQAYVRDYEPIDMLWDRWDSLSVLIEAMRTVLTDGTINEEQSWDIAGRMGLTVLDGMLFATPVRVLVEWRLAGSGPRDDDGGYVVEPMNGIRVYAPSHAVPQLLAALPQQ